MQSTRQEILEILDGHSLLEGKVDELEGGFEFRRCGAHRFGQRSFNGGGQLEAVLAGQIDGAPRHGSLVAATSLVEHGLNTRVFLFERELREARVVARPLVSGQHRGMAGVAEDDRRELPLGTADRQ